MHGPGELRERQVEHRDVVGGRVRARVARTKDPGERLLVTEQRVEAEPCL